MIQVTGLALEQLLADLPRRGTLLRDRGYRQIWRFEFEGRGYILKFYPHAGSRLKRWIRGSPARREFVRLIALQKAAVPAPRAVAQLIGYQLNGVKGDAVVLEAIEPAHRLDEYLHGFQFRGEEIPEHRRLAEKLQSLLAALRRANLGHEDLHLGNLLWRNGEIFLLDGYAVRLNGFKIEDALNLGHSLQGSATRTDFLRAWEGLDLDGPIPTYNPVSRGQWNKLIQRTRRENDYFGILDLSPWRGFFFKKSKFPRRWSEASQWTIARQDWIEAWPKLWRQIEAGELEPLKRSPSGDVWGATVTLGGKEVDVIVKRPYKRHWYRYINEIGRGTRAWRAWSKAWSLIVRDVPTAWPLIAMEKRRFGYVIDSAIVFQRIKGQLLSSAPLDDMTETDRQNLFYRLGRNLRRIDRLGLSHFDAKSSNWIIQNGPKFGPQPILIDVDGIRTRRWPALGIDRLLRAMREHRQYTPADSLALCRGYAPFSRLISPD
jgi:tRNA A-37 threonylcarbamoyl transferase component Bud32/uncharacterized protein YifE (UPF0438 family)